MLSYDEMLTNLTGIGVPRELAIATARKECGLPAPDPAADDDRLEKAIEHEGDRLMQSLGFEVVRFSHPGKTKQTPGISDRLYLRRPRAPRLGGRPNMRNDSFAVWVEFKSAKGRQRPGQKLFQELVEACGQEYVCGGLAELRAWLTARGLT